MIQLLLQSCLRISLNVPCGPGCLPQASTGFWKAPPETVLVGTQYDAASLSFTSEAAGTGEHPLFLVETGFPGGFWTVKPTPAPKSSFAVQETFTLVQGCRCSGFCVDVLPSPLAHSRFSAGNLRDGRPSEEGGGKEFCAQS